MKLVSKLALGAALCTGISGLALAPAQAQPAAEEAVEFDAGEISEPVRAPVAAAQAALAAEPKDTATALSQTQSAVPLIVNDDDRFIVGQMLIQVGAAMQTAGAADAQVMPLLLQGAQLSLQSNRVEIARRPALYILIGNDAQEREDWPAALAAYENALRYAPQNADAAIQVANVQFRSNNIQAGYATIDRAIELKRASGQPVPDNWIMVPLRYAAEARDLARFNTYSEMLLRAYGTEPDRWHDILFSFQNLAALDDQANLDMFRLARATRSIQEPNEFQEYVLLATTHGLPGEAQAAQNAGIAASAWPAGAEPTAAELTAAATADRAGLAQSEASARSGANGRVAGNTADAYLSYGDHAKAIELYQLALQKGGVDTGTINLRLGAALLAAGRADEARAAFQSVTGSREALAKFWLIWLDQQAGGAPQPAPVPQPASETPSGS